jgi:RNA polymerase sigma factor (sigma-70 family)
MSAPAIRNYLRALGGDAAGNGLADAELVARFAATRDESAFELLVWRHAPLVQAVCRAVLRDHHAAEDAAQATFLVLARKAATFAARGSVVGWLYRVARRVSVRLATQRAKLPASATLDHLPERGHPDPVAAEYAQALCAEVDRLPERYRVPVLLCFFEGLTHAEAARRTGWPLGTVAGRLSRAKELLARRLSRRGVTLGAVALPAAGGSFVGSTAQAATAFAAGSPGPLVSPSVLVLAQGALTTMTSTLLKMTAAAAVLCAVTAGVWGFTPTPDPTPGPQVANARPAAFEAPVVAAPQAEEKPEGRLADARQRARSSNNLKQIMIAVHNYHDTFGHMPNDITGKDGKPLLSWRVAILPFIEQDNLYKQFKLDEPWDSENNKKLIKMMPVTYRVGFEPKDTTKTYYQVFAGTGTAFEPGRRIKFTDILDGTSNTIGVVEAGPSVEWTSPADIAYDPKKAFPKLDGPFRNVMMVSVLDGSVRAINPATKADVFEKLISRAGGEVVDFDATKPDLKAVTKEDKELLAKMIRENTELAKKAAELLIEREKLVLELIKQTNPANANLDRLLSEQEDLQRFVDHLQEEIKAMKEKLKK